MQRGLELLRALCEVGKPLMLAGDAVCLLLHDGVEHEDTENADSKHKCEASSVCSLASARSRTPLHQD